MAGNQTLAVPVDMLGTAQSLAAGAGATLNLGGNVAAVESALGNGVANFALTGGGNVNVNGQISGNGNLLSGSVGCAAGLYVLNGDSGGLFAGNSTVRGGVLEITTANAVGTAAGTVTTVVSGGTFALAGPLVFKQPLFIDGSGAGGNGALQDASGNSIVAGGLTLGNAAGNLVAIGVARTGDTLVVAGNFAGNTGLNKVGNGILLLDSNSTYPNGACITAGSLQLANTAVLGTSAAVNIANNAGATLDLYGANITLTFLTGNGLVSDTRLNDGVTTLTVVAANDTYYGTITDGKLRRVALNVPTGNLTLAGTQAFTGGTTIAASGCLTLAGNGNFYGNVADSGNLWINPTGGNVNLGGIISGPGTLYKTGNGTLTLLGNNTYSGNTTVANGTVAVGVSGNAAAGTGAFGVGNLVLGNNAVLSSDGPGGRLINNPVFLAGNATSTDNVTLGSATKFGNLVFSGNVTIAGNNATLTTNSPVLVNGNIADDKASSGVLTTLASFNSTNGANPYTGMVEDSSGDLFGTTNSGGSSRDGTVFEIAAGSGAVSTLASFNGTNGAEPYGNLIIDSSGDLLGATYLGGSSGDGTVFEITAGSGVITTLASFNGTNGANPGGGVVEDGSGDLFGTAENGGSSGCGTVFEIAAGSGKITTLASFNGTTNGGIPESGLVEDNNGDLFGTTIHGGASGYGTVFEVAAGSGAITTRASFNGLNGDGPSGSLVEDSGGNLYGTTAFGGSSGDGNVFKVAAGTGAITTLASFNGTNGINPFSGVVEDSSGNLFGATHGGGPHGDGTVFEIIAGSGVATTLASFNGTNGSLAFGSLIIDGGGNLFGTTYSGGSSNAGTAFKLAAGSGTITTLASFDGGLIPLVAWWKTAAATFTARPIPAAPVVTARCLRSRPAAASSPRWPPSTAPPGPILMVL